MHSHSSSHRSESETSRRQIVPVPLPRELFTNRVAYELQHKAPVNITQALAALDRGLNFKLILHYM